MTDIVLSGAEIVAKTLQNLNIDTVFGYAGSYAMPLIEKLPDFGIRFIAPTSEGAAAHAADGYYRASGRLAAVVTTHRIYGLRARARNNCKRTHI